MFNFSAVQQKELNTQAGQYKIITEPDTRPAALGKTTPVSANDAYYYIRFLNSSNIIVCRISAMCERSTSRTLPQYQS